MLQNFSLTDYCQWSAKHWSWDGLHKIGYVNWENSCLPSRLFWFCVTIESTNRVVSLPVLRFLLHCTRYVVFLMFWSFWKTTEVLEESCSRLTRGCTAVTIANSGTHVSFMQIILLPSYNPLHAKPQHMFNISNKRRQSNLHEVLHSDSNLKDITRTVYLTLWIEQLNFFKNIKDISFWTWKQSRTMYSWQHKNQSPVVKRRMMITKLTKFCFHRLKHSIVIFLD